MPDRVRVPGLLEGDRTANGPSGNGRGAAIFRRRSRAFASRNKIAAPLPSSALLRPCAALRVLVRPARRLVIATKAAMDAVDPAKDFSP